MKTYPVLFKNKQECCGCSACYSVCSQNAITMKPDEEGFDYPEIDKEKCVRCYQCINVCPMKNNDALLNL